MRVIAAAASILLFANVAYAEDYFDNSGVHFDAKRYLKEFSEMEASDQKTTGIFNKH